MPCLRLAGVVRLDPDRLRAAGFIGAHALTEVEPDVERCRADPARLLTELAARTVPRFLG